MAAARNRVWNNLAETYGLAGSNTAAGLHNAVAGAFAESAAAGAYAENAAAGHPAVSGAGNGTEDGFNELITGNRQPALNRGGRGHPRRLVQAAFWRKSVRIPLPAAAAILVFAALFLLLRPAPPPSGPPMPAAISAEAVPVVEALPAADIEPLNFDALDFDAQAAGSMSTMNEILRYIEAGDSSNVVIIKLPEKKNYNRTGGPVILRAVDYAKNASGGGSKN